MKVVIEKTEASIINFTPNKKYFVVKNFSSSEILGTATVFLDNGIMYANLKLRESIKGFPAIAYTRHNKVNVCILDVISICDTPNVDPSIERIEYALQSEGKPSNLKTK